MREIKGMDDCLYSRIDRIRQIFLQFGSETEIAFFVREIQHHATIHAMMYKKVTAVTVIPVKISILRYFI